MSFHYSAGQYDDAFSPKRLKNWNYDSNWEDINNRSQSQSHLHNSNNSYRRFTGFVANARGHLLPHVYKKSRSSPWGDYGTCIWDVKKKPKAKTSQAADGAKIPRFKPKPFNEDSSKKRYQGRGGRLRGNNDNHSNAAASNRKADPIITVLKAAKVPIIWIVGLPTKNIIHSRRHYARQLAELLDFAYINLDEEMFKWEQRELDEHGIFFTSSIAKAPPAETLNTKQQAEAETEFGVSIDLKLSQSKTYLDFSHNLSPAAEAEEAAAEAVLGSSMLKSNKTPHSKVDPIELLNQLDAQLPKIQFNTTGKLSREKLMELYKYAMIEAWPTQGYVIEGFPYDTSDAIHFETMFYPISLGIYFTESNVPTKVRQEIPAEKLKPKAKLTETKFRSQYQKKAQQRESLATGVVKIHCINTSEDDGSLRNSGRSSQRQRQRQPLFMPKPVATPFHVQQQHPKPSSPCPAPVLIYPKYAKRNKTFSFIEAHKLCNLYGAKIVRVINAESILMDTIGFVNAIVNKHLKKLGIGTCIVDPIRLSTTASSAGDDETTEEVIKTPSLPRVPATTPIMPMPTQTTALKRTARIPAATVKINVGEKEEELEAADSQVSIKAKARPISRIELRRPSFPKTPSGTSRTRVLSTIVEVQEQEASEHSYGTQKSHSSRSSTYFTPKVIKEHHQQNAIGADGDGNGTRGIICCKISSSSSYTTSARNFPVEKQNNRFNDSLIQTQQDSRKLRSISSRSCSLMQLSNFSESRTSSSNHSSAHQFNSRRLLQSKPCCNPNSSRLNTFDGEFDDEDHELLGRNSAVNKTIEKPMPTSGILSYFSANDEWFISSSSENENLARIVKTRRGLLKPKISTGSLSRSDKAKTQAVFTEEFDNKMIGDSIANSSSGITYNNVTRHRSVISQGELKVLYHNHKSRTGSSINFMDNKSGGDTVSSSFDDVEEADYNQDRFQTRFTSHKDGKPLGPELNFSDYGVQSPA